MNTSILKNTTLIGISNIISYLFGFFLLIGIARHLGETEFGRYSFAISYTALFSIMADLGINQYLVREFARNQALVVEYISNAVIMKLLSSITTILFISISINIFDSSSDTVKVVCLFGVYIILNSYALTFRSVFQASDKMDYLSALIILDPSILLISIYVLLCYGYGIIEIAYAYIFASSVDILVCIALLKSTFLLNKAFNLSLWRRILLESLPFGLNNFFSILFFRIDTVMLSIFVGNAAVGIYNAAYNPLLAVGGVISSMVVVVVYPIMSRYYISSKSDLESITNTSAKYMAIFGVPITIGCLILSDRFIDLLYGGNYSSSMIAFQILSLFIPIRLFSSITGTLLTSTNNQNYRMFSVCLSALFNIILNLILIPLLGYIGASISTVLSEIVLYILYTFYANKFTDKIKLYKYLTKPFIASISMALLILLLKDANLFLLIVLSGLVYFFVLILVGTFSNDDFLSFKQILRRFGH